MPIIGKFDKKIVVNVAEDLLLRSTPSGLFTSDILYSAGITQEQSSICIAPNTISFTNVSNIIININKTDTIKLGTFVTTLSDYTPQEDVHEPTGVVITPDIIVTIDKIEALFSIQKVFLMAYMADTNTILFNRELHDTKCKLLLNDCLIKVLEYNIANNIKHNGMDKNNIMLGTDPEFLIINKSTKMIVPANTIITNSDGDVGCDGRRSTGELRPQPSNSPYGLSKNVKALYKKLNNIITASSYNGSVAVVAGGGKEHRESLGGHIHFGMTPSRSLITMLDDFIGIPLQKIKGGERASIEYGVIGDMRHQPHGFEYRTPPSFVGDPKIFTYTMAVAKCICNTWVDLFNKEIENFTYKATPSIEEYLTLSGADNYKVAIYRFYDFITTDESTLYIDDVLAAWKIDKNPPKIIVQENPVHSLLINYRNGDHNLRFIRDHILTALNGITPSIDCNIYIYGIGRDRRIHNILMSYDYLPIAYERNGNIAYCRKECLERDYGFIPYAATEHNILFGIPYHLREDPNSVDETAHIIETELRHYFERCAEVQN